jgi:hypothetical protein
MEILSGGEAADFEKQNASGETTTEILSIEKWTERRPYVAFLGRKVLF